MKYLILYDKEVEIFVIPNLRLLYLREYEPRELIVTNRQYRDGGVSIRTETLVSKWAESLWIREGDFFYHIEHRSSHRIKGYDTGV